MFRSPLSCTTELNRYTDAGDRDDQERGSDSRGRPALLAPPSTGVNPINCIGRNRNPSPPERKTSRSRRSNSSSGGCWLMLHRHRQRPSPTRRTARVTHATTPTHATPGSSPCRPTSPSTQQSGPRKDPRSTATRSRCVDAAAAPESAPTTPNRGSTGSKTPAPRRPASSGISNTSVSRRSRRQMLMLRFTMMRRTYPSGSPWFSTRDQASIVRSSASWTRSAAACGLPVSAWPNRRSSGMRARANSSKTCRLSSSTVTLALVTYR